MVDIFGFKHWNTKYVNIDSRISCKRMSCALQVCLAKKGYDQSRCEWEIKKLERCCSQNRKSVVCRDATFFHEKKDIEK